MRPAPISAAGCSGKAPIIAAARSARPRGRNAACPSGSGFFDAQLVVARLEEAGRTLLALPPGGYSTGLRTNTAALVRHMIEAGEGEPVPARLHPPTPSAAVITRMDEALGWIPLIPRDRSVLRRIVGARALVNPMTDRHLYSWRRLGTMIGADHKAVQRWHAQAVDMIVAALNAAAIAVKQPASG